MSSYAVKSKKSSSPILAQATCEIPRSRLLVQAIRLSLALGAGIAAFPAHAIITCPVSTTVNVTTAETLDSACTVQNGGTIAIINNTGSLTNNDVLTTEVGGSLNNYQGTINNAKNLDNHGALNNGQQFGVIPFHSPTLNNQSGSTLNNFGKLYNGSVVGSLHGGTLNNAGTLINSGTLENVLESTLVNSGTLTNKGLLHNAYDVSLVNDGMLNNEGILRANTGGMITNNGTLYNLTGATLHNGSGFSNNGTLVNYGELTTPLENSNKVYNHSPGTLNLWSSSNSNSGFLENDGTLNNNAPLDNLSGGTLNNWNGLNNNDTLYNSGTLNNHNGGTLTNSNLLNNSGGLVNWWGGTLDNKSGATLDNTGGLDNHYLVYNHGTLNNQSGGTLNNMVIGGKFGASTLNNDGGTINNAGTLNNQQYNGEGATLNNNGGTINNTGTLNNESAATLNNYNYGALNNQSNSTLNNFGTLDNGSLGANPLYGGTLNNYGTLNNSGTLNNQFGRDSGDYATLNNKSGGTLDNTGKLYNYFRANLINESGATLNNAGILDNWLHAEIRNDGTLNNKNGGLLTNGWSLTNNGTLDNQKGATLYSGRLTNDGILKNAGQFTVSAVGSVDGTGTFTQTGGNTLVYGTLSQATVDIQGGTLGGTGTITTDTLTIGSGATLSPGNSPGTLTVYGNLDLNGTLLIEINGTTAGTYDVLDVHGVVDFGLNSLIDINLAGLGSPTSGFSWDFLLSDFAFTHLNNVHYHAYGLTYGVGVNYQYSLNDVDLGGGQHGLRFELAVPEPGSLSLLGLGGLLLARSRRRAGASA